MDLSLSHYTTSMASTVGSTRHDGEEIVRGGYNQTSIAATGLQHPFCNTLKEEVIAGAGAMGGKASCAYAADLYR